MRKFSPPFLGAAYYPEDWPLNQIDEDIRLMKEAGLNIARIGEFAWSKMEPAEGQYDFSWLHLVTNKLGKAGIAVILGTPTCTPPAWLSEKYPEILSVNDAGIRAQHGARRHACPNSPVYRDLCERIVEKMAREFGADENVIGWQIDNELFMPTNRGCACHVCLKTFRQRLREKFGTIENLNETWGTHLWSQTYQSFDQVPYPRENTWRHPSLLQEWMLFQSDSYVDFARHQADILHKIVKQPVGTDMMPTNGVSYYRMNQKLDVVQFNHYHNMENLANAVFWFDWCRPILPRPFWNTETMTCWAGSTSTDGYKDKGFCTVNTWLPIALGAEANLYWLWRAHWSGQELMHGSVITSHGRPMHIFGEIQALSRDFKKAADFINGTKPVRNGIAVHFSNVSWHFFAFQPIVWGFNYGERIDQTIYRPLNELHLRPDVIDPATALDPYKIVVSFFLPAIDEAGLRENLKAWIENGGTWIVGPFTDIRTLDGTKFKHAPFGSLEEWSGVRLKYEVPGNRDFAIKWKHGTETKGSVWYKGFELQGAESLASYAEYPFEGLSAVTRRKFGKGQIIILGTILQKEEWKKFILKICEEAGVKPVANASENLVIVPREGDYGKGMAVVEIMHQPGHLFLKHSATDILTGRKLKGKTEVKPYEVLMIVNKK